MYPKVQRRMRTLLNHRRIIKHNPLITLFKGKGRFVHFIRLGQETIVLIGIALGPENVGVCSRIGGAA